MRFFVQVLLIFLTTAVFGQSSKIKVVEQGIIINNTTDSQPAPTAVLDVSSSDKGAIFPRLTQVQIDQIANPDEGLLLYNKDKRIYQFYNGSEWLELGLSIPLTPPNAPSNLVASATFFDQIDLTWTDDSDDETGFEIWRSLTSGSGYVLVGSVDTDVSSHTDTGLASNTQYFYVVLATGGLNSVYSNEGNATTPNPFVSIWNTTNEGVSTSNQITLPLVSGGNYDFTIN